MKPLPPQVSWAFRRQLLLYVLEQALKSKQKPRLLLSWSLGKSRTRALSQALPCSAASSTRLVSISKRAAACSARAAKVWNSAGLSAASSNFPSAAWQRAR